MIEVRQTDFFSKWLVELRDLRARSRIQARIDRLESGNLGDAKPVGAGVSEMRIDYGPGYRVYFHSERIRINHSSRRRRQKLAVKGH